MAKYTIELAQRFEAAFGRIAGDALINSANLGYKSKPATAQQSGENKFKPGQAYTDDEILAFSKMGTPLFDRFVFTNTDSKTSFTTEFEFQLPPLVDLKRSKRIATTIINDGDFSNSGQGGGEVVESWGNKPFDIKFRGILVDMDNHKRPADQIQALSKIFNINDILEVKTSRLFSLHGISQIYVEDIDWPALENYPDTQPFMISARSYVPAELFIAN